MRLAEVVTMLYPFFTYGALNIQELYQAEKM